MKKIAPRGSRLAGVMLISAAAVGEGDDGVKFHRRNGQSMTSSTFTRGSLVWSL